MKIRKYIGFLFFLSLVIVSGFIAFFVTLAYMAEHTGNDNDIVLAGMSSEFDVTLGSVYTLTAIVDDVYSGHSLKNDEEKETSYVLLDNGVLCRFYTGINSDIEGKEIKVMGRAEFSGGIVILDNCTTIEDDE